MRRLVAVCAVAGAAAAPATAQLGIAPGTIATVAGTGAAGVSGDGGPATQAAVDHPRGLAVLQNGSVLVAEPYANVVRRIAPNGTMSTAAGEGRAGFAGDGGPATAAQLDFVHGVAAMPDGGFVVADTLNERIRRVFADGTIATVAGTGTKGYNGDERPATSAALADPRGVATFPDGRILIPDTDNDRIRLVALDGTIRTVAGDGTPGFAGDGGPATSAKLRSPFGVAPVPDGGFLVDDSGNSRIRRVSPKGLITTVAGDGVRGYGGDGGPAVAAKLNGVHSVAAVPGGFVIADTGNERVRLVRAGVITTVAGTGVAGFSGAGGSATAAQLDQPKAVALSKAGAILIADSLNNRVRLVEARLRPAIALRLASHSVRARRGAPIRIRYSLGAVARVRARVLRGRKLAASASAAGRVGANVLVLRKRLRPGRYRFEVTATAEGASARAAGVLTVTRR
jgi:hypothetical protein